MIAHFTPIYVRLLDINQIIDYTQMIVVISLLLLMLGDSNCQNITFTPVHEKMMRKSLAGSWTAARDSQIFAIPGNSEIIDSNHTGISFFSSSSGDVEALLYQSIEKENQKKWLFLQLFDPSFMNKRVIEISIKLEDGYNSSIDSWKIKNTYSSAKLFSDFKEIVVYDFEMAMSLKQSEDDESFEIGIKSDSINVEVKVGYSSFGYKYFVALTIINMCQLTLLVCFGRSRDILFNTSEWLILQNSCFFVLESFVYSKISLSKYDTNLSLLLINAITNMLVMLLILQKFESVIQKFKNKTNFILAICFSILYFDIVGFNYTKGLTWVIESMLFFWQISHSMLQGGSGGVSKQLVGVILLSRIPLFFLLGSPEKLLRIQTDETALKIIICILSISLIVIRLQKRLGSRFFIPRAIIPDYYDYARTVRFEDEIAVKECSICLNELREAPEKVVKEEENKSDETSISEFKANQDRKITFVMTPCGHCYHQKCLGDWLQTKLVCPLCKRGLPPMNMSHN